MVDWNMQKKEGTDLVQEVQRGKGTVRVEGQVGRGFSKVKGRDLEDFFKRDKTLESLVSTSELFVGLL